MKTYFIIAIAILSIAGHNSFAQTAKEVEATEQSIKPNGKYGLLVMNIQHLKAAVMTGIELKSKHSKIDFQILTCGALVKEIAQDKALQELITDAVNTKRLKILVCGLSIQQFNVDKSLLPRATSITQNGLLYMLGLQEQHYKTIIL